MKRPQYLLILVLSVLFLSGLFGCVGEPTRIVERTPILPNRSATAVVEPVVIGSETIVVDTRRPFDFSSQRLPRSFSMQWSDFSQGFSEQRGVLQTDLFAIARRLARVGIAPDSQPIVVVGYGLGGQGEEGRVAWMLKYLGIERVGFSGISAFPGPFVTAQLPKTQGTPSADEPLSPPLEPTPKNAPIWKPELREDWIATRAEVKKIINENLLAVGHGKTASYIFVDVRDENDYLGKDGFGASVQVPNLGSINIPWHKFLNVRGQADCKLIQNIKKGYPANFLPETARIIVFDEWGLASGGVVVALRSCGYINAANYAGGLRDLLFSK